MIIKRFVAIGAVIAGLVGAAAGTAAAATGHPASAAKPAAATHQVKAAGATKGSPNGEDPSHESDGPGGHQDPDGQNVDHQFEGAE